MDDDKVIRKTRDERRRTTGQVLKSVKDLDVYRKSFDAAMKIFELSKNFPKDEKYSLTDQIRRSSRSVAANISEAWRKRRYQAMFVNKLTDASMESAETQTWLDFAKSCGYIQDNVHSELMDSYEHIFAMLKNMENIAHKFCGGE